MAKKIYLTLLCLLSTPALFAVITEHRTIMWKEPIKTTPTEKLTVTSLFFEGANYDEQFVPVYYEKIPLVGDVAKDGIAVSLENAVYEPLKEVNLLPPTNAQKKLKSEATIAYSVGYCKKKSFACITVYPFRKTSAGIERLVSFDIKIEQLQNRTALRRQKRNYAPNSVLASGNWYKIGTTKDGIYKISYQFLKSTGMDIDHIDPRTIRLYGNGSGQLPFLNSDFRYDDLQENAIYISGESDGKFNNTDYLLFYSKGQMKWEYDTASAAYEHSLNDYADTAFYFITYGTGSGKRIPVRPSSSLTSNQTVTSYDEHFEHEVDELNLIKSGRLWVGEPLDNSNSQMTWSVSDQNLITTDSVKILAAAVTRTFIPNPANLVLKLNGNVIGSTSIQATTIQETSPYGFPGSIRAVSFSSSSLMDVSVSFSSGDASGLAWIDYLDMTCRNSLSFTSPISQFQFRDNRSVGSSNVSQFIISNASSSTRVWDVSDPLNVEEQQVTSNSGQINFTYPTDKVREYVAFAGNYNSPVYFGKVANQNLHALPEVQMVIVTNPLFLNQANTLASFHRTNDNLTVQVVTTEQVFNEYSSGAQDVCAIRDFMKMFYDRATLTDMPKYLLLMGDASYDNKHRFSNNTDYVTSYESLNSLNLTTSYISDDFFGLLDDNEGIWDPADPADNEILDLSVGRLPVKTPAEATSVVNKIITYSSPATGDNTVFGDWRNSVTFVADDQDFNTHFSQAESLSIGVRTTYPVYNIDKIYLDAYKQEDTPGGQRFPDAQTAIVNKVQRGTLLMTWIGHGGESGWAHERVLEVSDINNWTNSKHLAAFLTATCEFTRVDDPTATSAGELVLLNPNGGGICLFSTTRLAYSGSNFNLATKFFTHVFEPVNGVMPTCGDIFEQTKIDYTDPFTRNFLLIGDPAMRLAYPKFDVVTNSINTHPVSSNADTLSALSKVTITGELRDKSGSKLTSFNGIVYPTVYDKVVTERTLGNDQYYVGDGGTDTPANFLLQKNILYKGKASVKNGDFTFTFIVPKDIAYQYGFGKLSYYADNGTIDANGYYTNVVIGGINTSAAADNTGPDVKLYMNDDKFVFGGMTDANPSLYSVVHDENGINTVGNGIGHDITSTLDDDNSKIVSLNDYYEADIDNYQSGKVKYPFYGLADGRHTLKIKVWDVYNNSSEARTEFVVAASANLALDHVLNYPNPFTTHTTFMFEHNHGYSQLQAQVQIFTVSGKLIKTLDKLIDTEGYRSAEIEWNGLDDYGDRIGRGVYVYKVRIKTNDGLTAEKFEKLVILR